MDQSSFSLLSIPTLLLYLKENLLHRSDSYYTNQFRNSIQKEHEREGTMQVTLSKHTLKPQFTLTQDQFLFKNVSCKKFYAQAEQSLKERKQKK